MISLYRKYRHLILAALITILLIIIIIYLPDSTREYFAGVIESNRNLYLLILLFAVVMLSLIWSFGQKIDEWFFITINLRGYRLEVLDRAMLIITHLGDGLAGFSLAAVFYISGEQRLGIVCILGILTLWLIVEIIKAMVNRQRPYKSLLEVRLVGISERGLSFPSGHTSQAFFLATLTWRYFNFDLLASLLLFTTAVLVGISRVYIGVHYPRDVFAGSILGIIWGIVTGFFL